METMMPHSIEDEGVMEKGLARLSPRALWKTSTCRKEQLALGSRAMIL
jgi:hypothetical protein